MSDRRAHLLTCGDQIKGTQKNGVCHGLESNRRKLETTQGPSQGEVGSAHRRRSRRHQWAARPARGQDSGTLRPCQGPGQKGCRGLVQVTAVTPRSSWRSGVPYISLLAYMEPRET